jgi:hypothetical protein
VTRIVLAIDPGMTQSAYLQYDMESREVVEFGILSNPILGAMLDDPFPFHEPHSRHCVIEMVQSFGMPVGREVFETVYWIGRFAHAWDSYPALTHQQIPAARIYRGDVKQHLCHTAKAKDANIRQALIDRFGGESAIGKKKTPGPLYGISKDVWSALAIAVTYADRLGALKTEAA